MVSKSKERPIGVWITSIWLFLGAAFSLLITLIVLFSGGSFIGHYFNQFGYAAGTSLAGLFIIISIVSLLFAIISFAAGYGVFQMRKWGQILATVLFAIGLLSFPIGTIINIIMLLLLWAHKETRECFE